MVLSVVVMELADGVEPFEGSKSDVALMSELRHPLMVASVSRVVRKVLQPCEIPVGIPVAADCVAFCASASVASVRATATTGTDFILRYDQRIMSVY
jgi:hypothetical protein